MIEKRDLKDLLERNTIVIENIPDLDGNTDNPDGTPRVWRIEPLSMAQELAVEKARMNNTTYLQRVISSNQARWKALEEGRDPERETVEFQEEETDPLTTAQQWAPIVAAMVKEPQLDKDELIENFHGLVLRYVGEEAEAFFREGAAKVKENREARRQKK